MYYYQTAGTEPQRPPDAVAVVMGSPAFPSIRGTVKFTQMQNGVHVKADITGLPMTMAGFFGFHLHSGNCGRPTTPPPVAPNAPLPPDYYFPQAGEHFNPYNQPHPRHAGDFPPLLETSTGTAQLCFLSDRFTVQQALGRAVIIHHNPDDLTTQPSGNSGPMIACGQITPAAMPY